MKRLLGLTVLLSCFVSSVPARGEDKTVGVVLTADLPYYAAVHEAFEGELKKQGLGPDKVRIVVQRPEPARQAWCNSVRKFVAFDVSVIVTYGAGPTASMEKEKVKIAGVYAAVADPQGLGFSRGNITGIGSAIPIAGVVKHLKSISQFTKLCVVYSEAEEDTVKQAEEVEKLGAGLGYAPVKFNLKAVSADIQLPDADAIFITTSSIAMKSIGAITQEARRRKIPTASVMGGGEEEGVILAVYPDPQEQGVEAAGMVSRIIKGAAVSAVPEKVSGKVSMVVNLKEAKDLGLNVPLNLVMSATKVIK